MNGVDIAEQGEEKSEEDRERICQGRTEQKRTEEEETGQDRTGVDGTEQVEMTGEDRTERGLDRGEYDRT